MSFPKGLTRHPLNKSRKMPDLIVSVWDFGTSHPQTERRFYGEHPCPAKMRPDLVKGILDVYGEEPILDPMCGSGTTNITSALLGLESYGIDIEKNYVEALKENLSKLPRPLNKVLGKTIIENGSANNLPFSDGFFNFILFSPPYWKAIQGKSRESWGIYEDDEKIKRRDKYSDNPKNLGNKKEYKDYLDGMLDVYKECYRVLNKDKLMFVVVKDINDNYLKVPIGADTIKLCQEAGFKIFDIIINKMYFPSYWMVHYFLKQQESGVFRSLTTHEYIIVGVKQ